MGIYLLKRLLLAAFTLLVILFVSYCLLRMAPGDPTRSNLFGSDSSAMAVDAEKGGLAGNQALRRKLNLDKPLAVGFILWLKGVVVHGDFGESAAVDPGRPVTDLISERLPVTLTLNIFAVALTYLLAVPLGVLTAERAGSFFDRSCEFLLFVLYSLPVMWIGLLLQAFFCEGGVYEVFPLKGAGVDMPEKYSIWQLQLEYLKSIILPVCCLSYGGFAGLSPYARSGMLETAGSDYMRTARAKGLSELEGMLNG